MGEVTGHGHKASAVILKTMGLFGSVQGLSIICALLRAKLIALWIGPVGVGLLGLYNATVEMLSSATQLNLRTSAVRDISAHRDGDRPMRDLIVSIVVRWSWVLGAVGALVMLAGAPLLSRITFGDMSHTVAFLWLSVVMLLSSLTGGREAVLQGLGRLNRLAGASVWGTVAGTAIAIPMYRLWGEASIVPSIIVFTVSNFIAIYIASRRQVTVKHAGFREMTDKGREFLALGAYMTVSAFATYLASYLFMIWLNSRGGESMVGYYQAGYTVVTRYVGLIFTAIAVEYFPRLSKVARSARRMNVYMNHEAGVVLWVLMPCVTLMILFHSLIVTLLYSSEFAVIGPYIVWGAVGIVFRGLSWCMAYMLIARGAGKYYLLTELLSCVLYLVCNVGCYIAGGIEMLGFAYMIWYIGYALIVAAVCRKALGIVPGRQVVVLCLTVVMFAVITALLVDRCTIVAAAVTLVAVAVSFRKLSGLLRGKHGN